MRKGLLLNGMVLALLAAMTAGLTFATVPALNDEVAVGWSLEGEMTFDQTLQPVEASTARMNGRDSVTLLAGSQATVSYDETNKNVTVDLISGGVIFSTLADDLQVTVNTAFARVDSQHSTAYVELKDDQLNVYAINHPSLVTFLVDGSELSALSVPSTYRMKVPASKVTSLLAKLRLTKLSKEFPVFALADGDLSEEVSTVLDTVEKMYSDSSVVFLNFVQDDSDFGPALTGVGGTLSDGYRSFRDALTLLPTAKNHLQELRKEDALVYAMTNYLYGDSTTADFWLSEWTSYSQDPTEIEGLYSSLFFVLPGDELYPVKAAAAQILYPQEDPLDSLRRQYGQIESLLDRASHVEAGQAYEEYQTLFETALDSGAFDDPSTLSDISREYMLLELMLRSNAIFYDVDSTQLLKELEEKILALAGTSQDLDEEKQAFVQSKLRFLNNLFTFVEQKKVDIDAATDLANELIFEANTTMGSLSTQVAVTSYFQTQLEEAELSVQFMNSPEFYSYDTFEEGLEAYRAKQADLTELNAYIQNIRSGQEEQATVSAEAAQTQVEDDLYSHGIQFSSVESLGDSANRLFEINGARSAGYSLEAKYDRETQILYDVVIGDVRFSSGLKLEDAKEVIEQAMASQTEEEEEPAEETETDSEDPTSLSETVALNVVRSHFEDAGMDPDDFVFALVDLDENTFTFEGTATDASLPVSGSYDADTERVTEIVWEMNGSPQTLPDQDLENFEEALYGTYNVLRSQQ